MVGAEHQHKGVGRAAMQLVIEHVRRKALFEELSLSYVPAGGSPERFYRSFGFRRFGEMDEDEVVMELVLSEPSAPPTRSEEPHVDRTVLRRRRESIVQAERDDGPAVSPDHLGEPLLDPRAETRDG